MIQVIPNSINEFLDHFEEYVKSQSKEPELLLPMIETMRRGQNLDRLFVIGTHISSESESYGSWLEKIGLIKDKKDLTPYSGETWIDMAREIANAIKNKDQNLGDDDYNVLRI